MLGINAITITPEILSQVSDIDEFKGLWKGLDKHTTGLHLLGDVVDYGENFKRVLGALQEQPISTNMICVLHASEMKQKEPSIFRDTGLQLSIPSENGIAGSLDTALPEHIAPLLSKLCDWANEELSKKTLHPLLVAAVFTAVFLQISPFEEGNLRVARFLILLMLLKSGYMYVPYVSLSVLMKEQGTTIYQSLEHNQNSLESGKPDWTQWLSCFLKLLGTQKDTLYERLYHKEDDLKNLPALSSRIMALFKEHKRLQMKEIIKLTRGRRATIKLRLSELLEAGYLVRHGAGRGTWYSLV